MDSPITWGLAPGLSAPPRWALYLEASAQICAHVAPTFVIFPSLCRPPKGDFVATGPLHNCFRDLRGHVSSAFCFGSLLTGPPG